MGQIRSLEHPLAATNPTDNLVPASTAMLYMLRCHSVGLTFWQSTRHVAADAMLNGGGGKSSVRSSVRGSVSRADRRFKHIAPNTASSRHCKEVWAMWGPASVSLAQVQDRALISPSDSADARPLAPRSVVAQLLVRARAHGGAGGRWLKVTIVQLWCCVRSYLCW